MLTSEMDLALTSLNSAFSLSPSNLLDTEPIEHHGHHRRSPELSIGTLSMPSSSPANVSLEVGLTGIDSYCMYNPPNIDYDVTSLGRSSESTVVSRVASHDLPDTKEGIDELCPVCGDKVSGYHYGLLTCESCKGFFKRTVQNKKVYTCIAEKMCHIDKSQRKRCPYCRFQKCLDVGMKLEAVRADRMRGGRNKFGPMYKRDRARKLQAIRERSRPSSVAGTSSGASGMGSSSSANISYEVPYTPNGFGLKHEIQIPQISSVTSSPDSSSSPANFHYPGSTSQNPATVNVSLSIANSPAPGPSQSYNLSPTRQNGPPRSAVSLSPKNFQFETMIQSEPSGGSGMSMNHNNNNNINNNNLPMGVPCSAGGAKTPPLIRDLVQSLDDKEWQNSLYGLLQSQTYNQCEVDLFELLCKVLDQNLFTQVDWARNSFYFKELKVDDQMKLLQNSWSSMLILDHLHHRLHNHLPDESILPNGQKFDLLALSTFGCPGLGEPIRDLINKLSAIRFDVSDYACLKFLVLLNPDVKGLTSRYVVSEAHEQVQQAMFDYSLNCYQHVPEKFGKMMALLPELQAISSRGEEYLYYKHLNGCAHTQTLLMEMLHTKRKQ